RRRGQVSLQGVLIRARAGRLALQRVGFGLKPAQLPRPGRHRVLHFVHGRGRALQREREGGLEGPHGVARLAQPRAQIDVLDQRAGRPQFLADPGIPLGQGPGQGHIPRCGVEAQVGHGAGVVVHGACPARPWSTWAKAAPALLANWATSARAWPVTSNSPARVVSAVWNASESGAAPTTSALKPRMARARESTRSAAVRNVDNAFAITASSTRRSATATPLRVIPRRPAPRDGPG